MLVENQEQEVKIVICRQCGKELYHTLEFFYKSGDYLRRECKECTKKNNRKIKDNEQWTKDEVDFLLKNYPDMDKENIMEYIKNKSWKAIIAKAQRLKIKRSEDMMHKIKKQSQSNKKMKLKGRSTSWYLYFRGIINQWKIDSFESYNYKCALTKLNNKDLVIHHVNENFSNIVKETFLNVNLPIYENIINYTEQELIQINKEFICLHYKYGLGIPLSKRIHDLYHRLYGKFNNDLIQFEEFTSRYNNGEFDDFLSINTQQNIITKKKHKRLKIDNVYKIKELLNKGFPTLYIAKMFSVSEGAIYNIKINKSWKNIV